ncbi:hypothetical protein BDF20DRAFT_832820 [Mycotypha africana]|uniref:uncharacterized protein n=1 Tax=Mycotypha africana TaxID=64632 RepID=UPI0023015B0D|nr:uncharacterized protein BDF20DRAFT_832820 [Mycotypha africana]KAI8987934.1 hypothetical protein BDF20DRAFT_832820 [Mycotypha africana]
MSNFVFDLNMSPVDEQQYILSQNNRQEQRNVIEISSDEEETVNQENENHLEQSENEGSTEDEQHTSEQENDTNLSDLNSYWSKHIVNPLPSSRKFHRDIIPTEEACNE